MAPDFALTEESLDADRHVIAIAGEIDLFTAPEMKATLIGAIERLRSRDGALTIVNVEPTIAKTFEITGLDQIFTITETREEAIAALDGEQQTA